ncbi:unnamed protein product [Callosobruchus maculatus]|uniref:Uncharacterized protein n=1 Tax=Callosobruchus maculatus TaxID=64391 RepID=A0A653BXQ8_CALMS|nr:unnamed protein product [Callosobruchus maculatus]
MQHLNKVNICDTSNSAATSVSLQTSPIAPARRSTS